MDLLWRQMLLNLKYVANIVTVVLYFRGLILGKKQFSRKREEKKFLKERYPEMTRKDFKKRALDIQHYESTYLLKNFRRKLNALLLFLMIVFLMGVFSFGIFEQNFVGMIISGGVAFIFTGLFKLNQPKYIEKLDFWESYLKENPENPLRVVLNYDDPETVFDKKVVFNSVVLGLSMIVSQLIGLIL